MQNFSPLTSSGSHYENISCKYVQLNESMCRAKVSVIQPQGQNHGGSSKLTCKDYIGLIHPYLLNVRSDSRNISHVN